MHVTLIVPGLAAALTAADPGGIAPLARFARRAGAPRVEREGLVHATATLLGIAAPRATAPLRALGAGADPGEGYVLAADPVALVAGRDDVRFDARIDDLDAADAAALVAALDQHFAEDGLAFAAPRPGAWFVRSRREFDLETTAVDALAGRSLAGALPRGGDARTWRRWSDEIQMLLHGHPVNARREAQGRRPVSGVWLWGGGRRGPGAGPAARLFVAGADPVADLLNGVAAARGDRAAPTPGRYAAGALAPASASDAAVVVHLPAAGDAAQLAARAAAWIDPATQALERGEWESLTLLGDGHGAAVAWQAVPARGWARWWPGGARGPLQIPPLDED